MAAIYSLCSVITSELLGIDTLFLCQAYDFRGRVNHLWCVFNTKIDKNVNKIKDGVQCVRHIHPMPSHNFIKS